VYYCPGCSQVVHHLVLGAIFHLPMIGALFNFSV
jgi:hypothetical protein